MAAKPSLLLLVDSRSYIRSNCYQSQLATTLKRNFRIRMMSLRELRYAPLANPRAYDVVLSVLKLRSLLAKLDLLKRFLRDRAIHVYEQDIWQAYMDDSPQRGSYEAIARTLNLKKLLLTSRWWTQFAREKGLPAVFVRMGMLPELCDAGPDWESRPIKVGFQGTLHPHRKKFFGELRSRGLDVTVLPSGSYAAYLQNLHAMGVFLHTEDAPWRVNGTLLPRNALWIKETEVAARGTFAIRDHEDEAEAYEISELPTIMTFRSVSEVPDLVARIEAMFPAERRERMVASAEAMRQRNDWMTVVRELQ
ncbi:MAG TPA: hypothetical protein VFA57_02255 [Pseudolabrys sp.]|nr:hypothetical protein [Pseudolabrys sp.]